MKRIIMMLTLAVLLVAALTITSAGAFAAKACEPGAPGCDTETSDKNDRFTQTQRGQTTARGTEDTQTCGGTGSGKCPPGQFK
jgi:hypothetical protein